MVKWTCICIVIILLSCRSGRVGSADAKLSSEFACKYESIYTSEQRLKFYPFSVSDTIKLVSFKHHFRDYPINNGHIVYDSIVEQKILSSSDRDELTDILYNNVFRHKRNYEISSQCFYPRNAILFIDSQGSLKEYVIICFHCENMRQNSIETKLGDNCSEKMDKIRAFFAAKGIKFGTDISISSYPGETDGTELPIHVNNVQN
jgi:hypothetical protein